MPAEPEILRGLFDIPKSPPQALPRSSPTRSHLTWIQLDLVKLEVQLHHLVKCTKTNPDENQGRGAKREAGLWD